MKSIQTLLGEVSQEEEIITRRVEKWAREIGDNKFLFYGEDNVSITFREFNEMSNMVGHSLQSMGIEKGDKVSVLMINQLVTTVLMFAIWKVGAIYCPINYNYRGKLLAYQINDTMPRIAFTERNCVHLFNEIRGDIPKLEIVVHNPRVGEHDYKNDLGDVDLQSYYQQIPLRSLMCGEKSDLGTDLKYTDVANIVYTSGTTGAPKGVVETYRWINNYLFTWKKIFKQEDVMMNYLPLYHVGGALFNVGMTAWVGCQAALWDHFSTRQFWERVKSSGATATLLMDVMVPWLMQAEENPDDHMNSLNKVYMQPLPLYHHRVAERFGFEFVISGFGQTEAGHAAFCIIDELDNGTPPNIYKGYTKEEIRTIARENGIALVRGKSDIKKGFMGKESPLYEASILDQNDEECKKNEVGEFCLRPRLPHMLFKEYLGKPKETLEAFRNLWFHTGDACYRDQEGCLHFVDRMRGVIRVKGEFVSSYQVEDIINSHPKIDHCAVFPVPAPEGSEDEVAVWVVTRKGEPLSEENLMEWIKDQMPKFMQPKILRFVDDIPKTATGKIQKYKLRDATIREFDRESSEHPKA